MPAQHGLEVILPGVGSERREAVEGDAAAGGVEAGLGQAQRSRAVGDVALQVRVAGRLPGEALDLLPREGLVAVGGREVGHQPDHLGRRRRQL